MKTHLKFTQADAFTRTAFKGNPAAVFVLTHFLRDEQMQAVAQELNLSESAFVVRRGDSLEFDLRWFTPTREVDLCGHATLAAAHVLWEEGRIGHIDEARFHTRSGVLCARKRSSHICMNFPASPATRVESLPAALGSWPGIQGVYAHARDLLIELDSEERVRAFQPNLEELLSVPQALVIITSLSRDPQRDFVSRVFAPKLGILEDPVTGAAHCTLGPFWAERLGKNTVQGEQLSTRTGVVHVECVSATEVILSGQAVSTVKGIFTVHP